MTIKHTPFKIYETSTQHYVFMTFRRDRVIRTFDDACAYLRDALLLHDVDVTFANFERVNDRDVEHAHMRYYRIDITINHVDENDERVRVARYFDDVSNRRPFDDFAIMIDQKRR